MFELLKAFLLGAIQGITEFLPVSSTGHLILTEHLLGISQDTYGLTFDAALHMGTLLAIFWYFKDEWLKLIYGFLHTIQTLFKAPHSIRAPQRNLNPYDRIAFFIVIATIPAVIIGLLLEDIVNTVLRSPFVVALSLIFFSFVLIYVEKVGRKFKDAGDLKTADALIVGFAQAIALIPGVSRSGITIASGMWRGLKREQAAYFAFLLSAPIVAGAGGKKLLEVGSGFLQGEFGASELLFFAVGIVSAAIFGYLTIKYFLRFMARHSLYPFVYYRVLLGVFILILSLFNMS